MFNNLSDNIQKIMKKLKGQTRITEAVLDEMLKEVKLSLLSADVNFLVVKEFITEIKNKALGNEVLESLTPGEQVVKIVKDELVNLLGKNEAKLLIQNNKPTIILLCGLQGAGKTTFCAKLANYTRKYLKKKPFLIGLDYKRPAAMKQLEILAKSITVDYYTPTDITSVTEIAKEGLKIAESKLCDYIILDTAGRLDISEELMNELVELKKLVNPTEIMLCIDSMAGQESLNVAKRFNESLGIDSITLTKLDSDTRGGVALSVSKVLNIPVKFSSVGEKLNELEEFNPEQVAKRILRNG